MAPKKMTLQEFFTDETLGGSWADDDIDMASISVPIENYKHSSGSQGFDRSRASYGADPGPPYIVKLLNLPITSNDDFVEDLFRSRYTPFVKFKILADQSSNILETHVIKKVAFVELQSFSDMNKVLKWQDLYYKGSRRVVVEPADFNDFQHCMSFNKEHEAEISRIEDDFLSGKSRPPPRREILQRQEPRLAAFPELKQEPKKEVHKPKPNPFGLAKPVDVLARSQEIDKKLITINHTTIQTAGPDADIGFDGKKPYVSRRKSDNSSSSKPPETQKTSVEDGKPRFKPAAIPQTYSKPSGVSLAELLSSKPEDMPRSSSAQSKNSPKPTVLKPVILKKKHLSHAESAARQNGESNDNNAKHEDPNPPSSSVSAPSADEEIYQKDTDKSAPKVTTTETEKQTKPETAKDTLSDSLNGSSATSAGGRAAKSTGDKEQKVKQKEERPNFKKQLDRLTKNSFVPKERNRGTQGTRANGASRASHNVFKNDAELHEPKASEQTEPIYHQEEKEYNETRGSNDHNDHMKTKEHKWDEKSYLNYRIKDEAASDAKVARVIENSVRQRTKSLSERGRTTPRGRGRGRGRRGDTNSSSSDHGGRSFRTSDSGSGESNGSYKSKEVSPNKIEASSVEGKKESDTHSNADGKVLREDSNTGVSLELDDTVDFKSSEKNGRRPSKNRSRSPSKQANGDEVRGRGGFRGRGRGVRGRGRGRGAARGNVFNLHYVRKHDEATESTNA